MAQYSFSKKILQFNFTMGVGTTGGQSGNPLSVFVHGVTGNEQPASLRATAVITYMSGAQPGRADCAIYGLPLSTMNKLVSVGTQINTGAGNEVQISAGDDRSGVQMIFWGNIFNVYVDGMSSMPRVPLRFSATADHDIKAKMIPPTSVQGSADVAQTFQKIAQQAGLQFENHGVNLKVMNPYLHGSLRVQMSELAAMAGIQHIIDKKTAAIWPTGSPRNSNGHLISPQTGMVGYPAFESANIVVKELYDPSYNCGDDFVVKSDITAANGTWNSYQMTRELESEMPGGKWFQTIYGTPGSQKHETGNPN